MLKIKTTKLQEIMARAVKGAGQNQLVPLTNLMSIEVSNGALTVITTLDKRNYLYVTDEVQGDDFYACVSVDTLPKLISKMTCEETTLDIKDNCLEVIGNGRYTIELQLDENGEVVKFPNPLFHFDGEEVGEITLADVRDVLNKVRPSLSTSQAVTQYSRYYAGSTITATDNNKISSLDVKFFDQPRLITAEMVDLLETMVDENIRILAKDNVIVFTSPRGSVCGYIVDGVETFKIDAIMDYISKDYPSKCKVSKVELLQVLDRVSLFVGAFDSGIVEIAFEEDGLKIQSRQSNGVEKVKYIECADFAPQSGVIMLDRLRTQVKAQSGDTIDLMFGDEKSIKMVDDNCTLVVALGQ